MHAQSEIRVRAERQKFVELILLDDLLKQLGGQLELAAAESLLADFLGRSAPSLRQRFCGTAAA